MGVGAAVLVVLLAVGGYALYTYLSVGSRISPSEKVAKKVEKVLDKPAAAADARYTYVLLLGDDRRPGEKRARTDTIMLARLDAQTGKVVMLSIPRDTRAEVPGHGMTKINHAGAYGGAPLSIATVKKFTGLPVHHYVQIDFEGFDDIVDSLGGVDMFVERPVDYGQGVTIPSGMQHLNGKQALSVVRNRKAYADGDFARIRTQRAFLSAVARKATSSSQIGRLPGVVNGASNHIETDLSISEIMSLVRAYGAAAAGDLPGYTVPGSPKRIDGISYVVPDTEGATALFDALRRGETPTETAKP